MIAFEDEGLILSVRPHAEANAVISLLTFEHGRYRGYVQAGQSRRQRPVLQPGNRVNCVWKARLSELLGTFTIEPIRLYAAPLLSDPARLAALASAVALVDAALPERDPHSELYAALLSFLGGLGSDREWPQAYVRFELVLLAVLGFGLEIDRCALTGATSGLAFVSPRTGRAVTGEAAGAYADRLLPLPGFLGGPAGDGEDDIARGLKLAGHFLRRHIFEPVDKPVPIARDRLAGLFQPPPDEGTP